MEKMTVNKAKKSFLKLTYPLFIVASVLLQNFLHGFTKHNAYITLKKRNITI